MIALLILSVIAIENVRLRVNSGDAMLPALFGGTGILPEFILGDALTAGRCCRIGLCHPAPSTG